MEDPSGCSSSSSSSSGELDIVSSSVNTIRSVVIDDLNDSSFSDLEITPPPSPRTIQQEGRNGHFQHSVVSRPNVTEMVYHNEFQIASDLETDKNPIENASSTSGGEEIDMNLNLRIFDVSNANGNIFRTAVSVQEPLMSSVAPSEIKMELDYNRDDNVNENLTNEDYEADIDEITTQSQVSNAELVISQETSPSTTEPVAERMHRSCINCGLLVYHRNFKFCQHCFKRRRAWLPPKPRSKRKEKRQPARNSLSPRFTLHVVERSKLSIQASSTSTNCITQGLALTTNENMVDLNEGFIESDGDGDSPRGSTLSRDKIKVPSSKHLEESLTNNKPVQSSGANHQTLQPRCSFCCIRPVNSAFLHNKVGHNVSCYECAVEIFKSSRKCPIDICQERVLRVVKVILS